MEFAVDTAENLHHITNMALGRGMIQVIFFTSIYQRWQRIRVIFPCDAIQKPSAIIHHIVGVSVDFSLHSHHASDQSTTRKRHPLAILHKAIKPIDQFQ
jgi:hypothetical protein